MVVILFYLHSKFFLHIMSYGKHFHLELSKKRVDHHNLECVLPRFESTTSAVLAECSKLYSAACHQEHPAPPSHLYVHVQALVNPLLDEGLLRPFAVVI